MPASEPVSLPLSCPHCGHPITLTFYPGGNYGVQTWVCPHAFCRQTTTLTLAGSSLQAVPRIDPEQS